MTILYRTSCFKDFVFTGKKCCYKMLCINVVVKDLKKF